MENNILYYGDNLEILRNKIDDESIDLCYIDPPFNSKRSYFQIYNNINDKEDRAQAQAFIDTWTWDIHASEGYNQIITNSGGRFPRQSIELIKGLRSILDTGGLLAYLVSMTLRITEIYRVLKQTGSFYLHCDPTASHYLKLVLDAIFCSQSGDFGNEIIWCYDKWVSLSGDFQRNHDVIFRYTKTKNNTFNIIRLIDEKRQKTLDRGYTTNLLHNGERQLIVYKGSENKENIKKLIKKVKFARVLYREPEGNPLKDWWMINIIHPKAKERLGYPTQKPEALLERIITTSSNEGDIVLDVYCGCGTTIAVAERLKRKWIGVDITYQSISLVIKRLEDSFGTKALQNVKIGGIPQDMNSAMALANKQDDRLRKEFEKWAILTYTNNRAVINTKKGADKGIDGIAYFATSKNESERIIFQVKSGGVNRSTIATLHGDMENSQAQMAILITLEEPTKPMREEAASAGLYHHPTMGRDYNKIQIVTIKEMLENGKRLEMPLSHEVVKSAIAHAEGTQGGFEI